MYLDQGPKLRLTGRQCDQKLSVGDQNSKTGRQQAIIHLSPWHLKFQGKRAFLKRKQKAPVDNCSKTKRQFYDLHIKLPGAIFFQWLLPIRMSRAKTSSSNKKMLGPGTSISIVVAFSLCFAKNIA